MNRNALIKKINRAAKDAGVEWGVTSEGAKHTVYLLGGTKKVPIPRHREIGEGLTRVIFQECEGQLGKDWWK